MTTVAPSFVGTTATVRSVVSTGLTEPCLGELATSAIAATAIKIIAGQARLTADN
jgi:hypothetical protein